MSLAGLPFDWNRLGGGGASPRVSLHDETLRDGLQCPSMIDPSPDAKADILRALARSGIASACLALPGAGPRAASDARALLQLILDEDLPIRPVLAARTTRTDIDAVARCADEVGLAVEVTCFVGASPIRQWTEGWTPSWLEKQSRDAVQHATRAGLSVSFVVEDATRSRPDMLARLIDVALAEGAERIVLCDTVGHATPYGTHRLIRWVRNHLLAAGNPVGIDWHAHNDRGLAVATAVAAARAGADRIHGCLSGVGERVGNTDLRSVASELNRRGAGVWDDQALQHAERALADSQRPSRRRSLAS